MEFGQAIQNLIFYSDRIKDLDREIVLIEKENRKRLEDSVENGLIYFDKAKIVHDEFTRAADLRREIQLAEEKVNEAKILLHDYLAPFEGSRIVYQYSSDSGTGKTCQVFLEEDMVKFI
jgi:hypothetical protein